MKREMLIDHLAQAERHIGESRAHVERQRQIVEELVRDGQDVGTSRDLLELFKKMLARHVEDRDRVRSELAKAK